MSTRDLAALLAALAVTALAGCGPTFGHLDFDESTSPALPATLGPLGVRIPEGIAVGVTPVAIALDGQTMDGAHVELITSDEGILGLDPVAPGDDDGAPPTPAYVLYGVAPGQARISIFVDGDAHGSLPATVTTQ